MVLLEMRAMRGRADRPPRRGLGLATFAFIALTLPLARGEASAATLHFQTELECMRSMGTRAHRCLQWFSIASIEIERRGGRFGTRAACETIYGSCRLLGTAARDRRRLPQEGIVFMPTLLGIRVSMQAAQTVAVMPIVGALPTNRRLATSGDQRLIAPNDATRAPEPDADQRLPENAKGHVDGDRGPVQTYPVPRHRLPKRISY
jgi:hypothetical protein